MIAGVQKTILEKRHAHTRALEELREGYINELRKRRPDEAAERFAPHVLKIVDDQSGRNLELQDILEEVSRKPQDYPLLVWALMDDARNLIPADERENFDLSSSSKLKHLPQIARGLHKLYEAVECLATPVNSNTLVGALLDRMELKDADDFVKVWEDCRTIGNYECQGNIDLGELRHLPVKKVLVMSGDRDGTSYSSLLLSKLVDVHNSQMKHLLGVKYHMASLQTIEPHVMPWLEARAELHIVFERLVPLGQQHSSAARSAEVFLREWLLLKQRMGLELTGFSLPKVVWNVEDRMPPFQQVPDEMVLIRSENIVQVNVLPPECEKEIDDFFQSHGLLLDRVRLALEFIKKISLWVNHQEEYDAGKVSADLRLKEKIRTFCNRPQKPSLLDVFERSEKLCIRHLNALQSHLSSIVTAKPEDALDAKYRAELSNDQKRKLTPDGKRADLLLRKLVAFVDTLRQYQIPEKTGIEMHANEIAFCFLLIWSYWLHA